MNIEKNILKNNFEKQEFSREELDGFGEIWTEMIVDNVKVPKDFKEMNKDEVEKWMYDSMMSGVEEFVKELGIEVDYELIEKIKKTENIEEKSELELDYIKKINNQIDEIVKNFDKSGNKSEKWDSWPKRMRKTKEFNCVGAALLGANLLEKGEIKTSYGNPYGHVINIAQLSNGDWWYIDLGNNTLFKMEAEEETIADISVLKIKNDKVDYNLIPISENSKSIASVVGNLVALKNEAEGEETADDNIEKKEAKEYFKKHAQIFDKMDFSTLHKKLYPEIIELKNTEEMKNEISRIKVFRKFDNPIQDYARGFKKEKKEALIKEFKQKKDLIIDLFQNKNELVFEDASIELAGMLRIFMQGFRDLKNEHSEYYQDITDRIVARVSRM